MLGALRRSLVASCLALSAMVLAGCFHSDADLQITGDDRVSGTVTVTAYADPSLANQWTVPEQYADNAVISERDANTGMITVTLRDLGFKETGEMVEELSEDHISMNIERTTAGQISLSGTADLTAFPDAISNLTIRLPKTVLAANGEVIDNAVSWHFTGGTRTDFWVDATAGETDRNELILWIAIATGVGILAAAVVMLWAAQERQRR